MKGQRSSINLSQILQGPSVNAIKNTPMAVGMPKANTSQPINIPQQPSNNKKIYYDNITLSPMTPEVILEVNKWFNCGNPHGLYSSGEICNNALKTARDYIKKTCRLDDTWEVIFTSGSTESFVTVVKTICDSYTASKNSTPHILLAESETGAGLIAVETLIRARVLKTTIVKIDRLGNIPADLIKDNILKNTVVMIFPGVNPENGSIANIVEMGIIAKENSVPLIIDATTYMQYVPLYAQEMGVHGFYFSANRMHGPVSTGVLCMRKKLISGYELKPLIASFDKDTFRGGCINMPGIMGMVSGMLQYYNSRDTNNQKLQQFKQHIIMKLNECIPARSVTKYMDDTSTALKEMELLFASGMSVQYMPNTLLFIIIKNSGKPIENAAIVRLFEANNVILSGVYLKSNGDTYNNILSAMGFTPIMIRGSFRISMGDSTTIEEVNRFILIFVDILKKIQSI